MLFPTERAVKIGLDYLQRRSGDGVPNSTFSTAHLILRPGGAQNGCIMGEGQKCDAMGLYVLIFPERFWRLAKAFWQHGLGISSRYAERILEQLGQGALLEWASPNECIRVRKTSVCLERD